MSTQKILIPDEALRVLRSLIGGTVGGVASLAPYFRESWEASYELYMEIDEGVIRFDASWAASEDDELASEIARLDVTAGVTSDFRRLSTWYHWWKGEVIADVLLVTDELTVEQESGRQSHLVHDIGVVLVCDVHAIGISLDQSLEFPNLIVGHELVDGARSGMHTHTGAKSLPWLTAHRVSHARQLRSLATEVA